MTVMKGVLHGKRLGHRRESSLQRLLARPRLAVEGDPHEEIAGLHVVELMRVEDVAAVLGKEGRNSGDDATARRASNGQGEAGHGGGSGYQLICCVNAVPPQ